MLPNSPEFIEPPEEYSLMYDPKPFILEEAIKRDIQIICFLNSLINKIVFDLQDTPALTKDIDPKAHGVEILPYYLPTS